MENSCPAYETHSGIETCLQKPRAAFLVQQDIIAQQLKAAEAVIGGRESCSVVELQQRLH